MVARGPDGHAGAGQRDRSPRAILAILFFDTRFARRLRSRCGSAIAWEKTFPP
jgi:hypothetical protein